MINDEHILDVDKVKAFETELELLHSNRNSSTYKNYNYNQPKVIFYCPFNHTYTKIEKYETKEIIDILNLYKKEDFFIIQINNDNLLYEELLKMKFKSEFENIDKLFDLQLDYCFSPIDELLCFNLSVLTNIDLDEIQKYLIQIFFSENGVYIINKDCCESILSIFCNKFNFKESRRDKFFETAHNVVSKEGKLINNMSIAEKRRKSFLISKKEDIMKNCKILPLNFDEVLSQKKLAEINSKLTDENNQLLTNEENGPLKEHKSKTKSICSSSHIRAEENINTSNFSTDDLIYYLLTFSLGKLEEFTNSLVKEAESLKGIYLELSEKERMDFFRRIHNMEISLQLIYQETVIKKKFLKYSKAQFKVYNKLSRNFYFKNTFNFFIELIISKVTQLEIIFEKLENTIRMIKENYSIIIEDSTEKQNIKLNNVMKVLAIITTIYTPLNIIPNLFGMNVRIPWQDNETLWPFFGILSFSIGMAIFELLIFKKLRWLDN